MVNTIWFGFELIRFLCVCVYVICARYLMYAYVLVIRVYCEYTSNRWVYCVLCLMYKMHAYVLVIWVYVTITVMILVLCWVYCARYLMHDSHVYMLCTLSHISSDRESGRRPSSQFRRRCLRVLYIQDHYRRYSHVFFSQFPAPQLVLLFTFYSFGLQEHVAENPVWKIHMEQILWLVQNRRFRV